MGFDPNKITFFGRTDARGKHVTFGIKAKDRQRHMYIIGKTGMGKSTLLENMAVQDIQNGEGLAFIDPHGSAAEVLLNYIPEHRMKDVLYFAPADAAYPVSFNIMEDVGPDKRHLVVSGLMSVFKKIWVDAWSARMEYILQNTLMALLEYPDSTLLGVNRMLSDKKYRDAVVANVKDPGVRAFWIDEFAKYNERYMQEAGDSIKNKIGQFTNNPIIRHIIGQPKSSFDIRQMMDEKKIIIMNLSKGLIGESNANLLGSMLTTRIYLAAMSRADLSPEKMRDTPNFYFYVDEFQSFANATFANILSEARKYHLNLTIAHQYITQMEEEVRDAVFGNVGTIISFRVGPLDAELLETIFTPQFLAADIVNLGFSQVYLSLMIDGIGSQPFSATTLPPIEPPQVSCKDMVIAASRSRFARTRAEVEVLIEKFHEPIVVEKPPRKETGEPKEGFREGMQTTVNAPQPPRTTPSAENGQRHDAAPSVRASGDTPHRHERPREREVRNTEPRVARTPEAMPRPVTERVEKHDAPKAAHGVRHGGHPGELHTPQDARNPVVETKRETVPVETPRADTTPPAAPTSPQPHTKKEDRLNELRSVLRGVVKTDETKQGAPKVGGKDTKAATFEKSHAELKNLIAQTLKNPPQHEPAAAVRREVVSPTHASKQNHVRRTRAIPRFVTPKITEVPPVATATQKTNQTPTSSGDTPVQNTPHPEQHGVTPKELERMMRVTTSDKPPL